MMHCFAYGDESDANSRIEAFLDAQCIGWRNSIEHDLVIPKLRVSDAPLDSKLAFDTLQDRGIFFAGSGLELTSTPGDHAVDTGIRAGRAASQS